MNSQIKNIITDYETLALDALKLNKAYLDLLKNYELINKFQIGETLKKFFNIKGEKKSEEFNKPELVKILKAMREEQDSLKENFSKLTQSIGNAKEKISGDAEATKKLNEIDEDCSVMLDFVTSIDLNDLEEVFNQVLNS